MSAFREFLLDDLLKLNQIFFDPLVEVYSLSFYLERLLKYPELAKTAMAPNSNLTGYIFGNRESNKKEDQGINSKKKPPSHSHICSLGIDHTYRRLGLGTKLVANFHQASELKSDWYVDLFVRESNESAIKLYESFGYVKYSWLPNFYKMKEHGYDMRKPLKSNVKKKSLEGRMINKVCNLGYMLVQLFMLYLLGLRDFLLGT